MTFGSKNRKSNLDRGHTMLNIFQTDLELFFRAAIFDLCDACLHFEFK